MNSILPELALNLFYSTQSLNYFQREFKSILLNFRLPMEFVAWDSSKRQNPGQEKLTQKERLGQTEAAGRSPTSHNILRVNALIGVSQRKTLPFYSHSWFTKAIPLTLPESSELA